MNGCLCVYGFGIDFSLAYYAKVKCVVNIIKVNNEKLENKDFSLIFNLLPFINQIFIYQTISKPNIDYINNFDYPNKISNLYSNMKFHTSIN